MSRNEEKEINFGEGKIRKIPTSSVPLPAQGTHPSKEEASGRLWDLRRKKEREWRIVTGKQGKQKRDI